MLRDLFSLFPACAGVILIQQGGQIEIGTFPRMCGGDPLVRHEMRTAKAFSPHVRG